MTASFILAMMFEYPNEHKNRFPNGMRFSKSFPAVLILHSIHSICIIPKPPESSANPPSS